VSSLEDARSRNIAKLYNSMNSLEQHDSESFLRAGGILDVRYVLKERARTLSATTNDNSKHILTHIVPPLEKLRSDLHVKIKEIKGLSNDFRNSVGKEQEHTRRQLSQLSDALASAAERPGEISPKSDPYLVKIAFERQLKHHLHEENFLHQAHRNIEESGRALEGLVVKIIRDAFAVYQEMLTLEANSLSEFAAQIGRTVVDLPVDNEWEAFIASTKEVVDPRIPIRTIRDIDYPGAHQITLIREGRLERKSKYLKSYSSAYYALSAVGYFHEFKSGQMQELQVSLFLPNCTLGGHSGPSDKSHKFVLKGNQSGGIHR
jgi:BAR-like domain/PH domain